MEFIVFQNIVEKIKKENPILFMLEQDTIPSEYEIRIFEEQNKIELTEKYKQFLLTYGGGFFGYTMLYSLDKNSEFYILNYNEIPLQHKLFIADNGCGDFYAVMIKNGKCQDTIFFYDHDVRVITHIKFTDIFEYLVSIGLTI